MYDRELTNLVAALNVGVTAVGVLSFAWGCVTIAMNHRTNPTWHALERLKGVFLLLTSAMCLVFLIIMHV